MADRMEIEVSASVDTSKVEKGLNKFQGDLKKTAEFIDDLGPKFAGEKTQKLTIAAETTYKRKQFKVLKDDLEGISPAAKKGARGLQELSEAQRGSVSSLKGSLNYYKQQLSYLNRLDPRYKNVQQRVKAFEQALNKANGIQKGSIAELRQQAAELARLASSYTIGSAAQKQFQRELDQVNAKLRSTEGPFSQFFGALESLGRIQSGFLALSTIVQGLTGSFNKFINQAKQVEGFELALKNIGSTQVETTRAFRDAGRIANELGAPIQQVEKSYKRMLPALKAVGVSARNSSRFIESISARTQTLGLNTEQSGRFLEAFAQVLSKGKLQAEELNQQISELDGAFRTQLADALGVSTQELERLITQGEITAEKFVKAVNRMENGVEELRKRVASGNFTVQQLQNLINNLSVENIRSIGVALEPAIKAFFDIGRIAQEFIKTLTGTNFGQFVIESINGIVIGFRNFVSILTEAIKAVVFILDPIFAVARILNNLLSPLGGIIGILSTYLTTIIAITTAQRVLNAALLLSSRTWTGIPQVIDLTSKSLRGLAKAIKAVKLAEMIPNLKNFRLNFNGLGKSTKKNTGTFKKFRYETDDLQALFNKMVPSLATGGATAVSTGGAFGYLSKGILAAGATVAAVTVIIGSFVKMVADGQQEAKSLDVSMKGLTDRITELGQETASTDNVFQALAKTIGGLVTGFGRGLFRAIGSENFLIAGQATAYRALRENINTIQRSYQKLGVNINDVNSLQKASSGTLAKLKKDQREIIDTIEDVIAVGKERIKQAKREGDIRTAERIEKEVAALQKRLPAEEATLKNINAIIVARKEQNKVEGNTINNLKQLDEFLERQGQLLEVSLLKKQIQDYEELGDAASNAYVRQVTDISNLMMKRNTEIKQLEYSIQVTQALVDSKKLEGEEAEKAQSRINEAQQKVLEKTLEQKKAQDELKRVTIDSFEARLQKSGELSQAYGQIAQKIASAASSAQSGLSSTLQSIGSAVDTVFSREIEGLRIGSNQRRKLVAEQVRAQTMISRMETNIAKIKNDIATRIAISELKTSQQRLRNEAAIARLRGDEEGARLLDAQANSTNDLIKLKQTENKLNNRALEIQQRLKEEKLLQKAFDEKVVGNITNKQLAEQRITEQFGLRRVSQQDIAKWTKATKDNYSDIEQSTKQIDQNIGRSEQVQAAAPGLALEEATKLAPAILSADKEAKVFLSTMDDIFDTTQKLTQEISKAKAALSGGTEARWMGGPVEAGQTYRVNDAGLGREAFMNKFGSIKMLPAGSNMNWTAPSSGTIIPAAMVKRMQHNVDLNSKIASVKRATPSAQPTAASAASTVNSGNLVKQMTAAMSASGGNQRITNNVTIQSQQPVTDASQIMTNVARMRLRNGRRI